MSTFLYSLGRWSARHKALVLSVWLVAAVALLGTAGLTSQGTVNKFTIPGTSSQRALDSLKVRFPQLAGAGAQMVVTVPDGKDITQAPYRAGIDQLVTELKAVPHVDAVVNPFSSTARDTISHDHTSAIVAVQLDVQSINVTDATRADLRRAGHSLRADGATVLAGGDAFNITVPTVSITEVLGIVIALLVLTFYFRSVRAGLLPIGSALLGAAVSLSLILISTNWTTISSTAPLLALMIGLAVGIDYALLVLSQHREHLGTGVDPVEAAGRALATAGTAVVFAGTTVIIALLALAVAGIPFLTTMGVCAAGAVAFAVVTCLTAIPAFAGLVGAALEPDERQRRAHAGDHDTLWHRWVDAVTARPIAVVVLLVVVLGALALPARSLSLALPDNSTAPAGSSQREAYDTVAKKFGPGFNAPVLVTVELISSTDPVGDVKKIAERIEHVKGVRSLTLATPNPTGDLGVFVIAPEHGASDPATSALITRLRHDGTSLTGNRAYTLAVTGQTAMQIDVSHLLAGALLPFGAIVVGLSFLLLAVVFRSILMPLAAALGYALSVAAAMGVTALVFDHGWGAGLIGVEREGPVISFLPIIVMGVLFGLAMDYQVFVVSRIWERHAITPDPRTAIREGFSRAAPVVVAAAVIMFVVFGAFVPQGDTTIKPIAFALATGVLVDAFLVRLVLMPAVLTLVGARAWAFPRRLDRALPMLDIEGDAVREQLAHAASDEPRSAVACTAMTLRTKTHVICDRVDFAVMPGRIGLVVGPYASGKTVVLLALAGRLQVDDGEVDVEGLSVARHLAHAQAAVSLTEIAGVNDLESSLTVEQHLSERIGAATFWPWVPRRRVAAWVDTVNALARQAWGTDRHQLALNATVAELAPLQRRLLGVAIALVGEPAVVVVDDVDALRTEDERAEYWNLLTTLTTLEHRGARVAVLASSRDVAIVPETAADAVVVLSLSAQSAAARS